MFRCSLSLSVRTTFTFFQIWPLSSEIFHHFVVALYYCQVCPSLFASFLFLFCPALHQGVVCLVFPEALLSNHCRRHPEPPSCSASCLPPLFSFCLTSFCLLVFLWVCFAALSDDRSVCLPKAVNREFGHGLLRHHLALTLPMLTFFYTALLPQHKVTT